MKKKILVMVSFLLLFLLSFRFFFQAEGIIGHNWDWGFPNINIFSEKLNILSIFTWNNYNLGGVADLTIVHLFPTSFFVLIGKLLGIKKLLFLLFFSVISVSFLSFKKLLDFLLEKSFLNYISSFLYAFSPFLFNDIIGGSWVMWVSYSLCPIYFVFLLKYLKKSGIKYLFFSLLISIFIIISFQNFVLINLLILLYLIYEIVIIKNKEFKNIVSKLFIFSILMILINLYWILPFSYTFANFTSNVILLDGGAHAFDSIKNSTQSIWNIFNLGGYHDRNMYLYALPPVLKGLFQLTVGLAWVIILGFFLLEKNRVIRQKVIFWMLSLLVLIIFVKGGNGPFSGFTLWLYHNFPLMKLFRSHLHLMLIPSFIIPILLTFSLSYFYKNSKIKKIVLGAFALIIVIWIGGWWYSGDLGHKTLLAQKRDHIDFYQLPPELIRYYEESQGDKSDYRSFFLPAVQSPRFLKTEYQNIAQGNQPEYAYLNKPTFVSENNKFADSVEISFCEEKGFDYISYLSLFSVKNIVLRSDIYPLFTKSAKCWDDDYVRAKLDSSTFLEKFLTGKYASAYKIKDDYYLPHFYIPQNIIYSNNKVDVLPDIVETDDYKIRSAIYLVEKQKGQIEIDSQEERNEEILEKTDEIFIEANLKNAITEEEINMIVNPQAVFPHARHQSQSFFYYLILKNEEFDKWKSRKKPNELFEKYLYYAGKRVSEIATFNITDLANYEENMDGAMGILEKTKEKDNEDFYSYWVKLKGTLLAHKEKIDNLSLDEEIMIKMRNFFENMDRKLVKLMPEHDFSQLTYSFDILKNGNYSMFAEGLGNIESSKQDKWAELGEKYFEIGEQEFILPYSSLGSNLINEEVRQHRKDEISYKIENYIPDALFKVKIDYRALVSGAKFIVVQDIDKDENGSTISLIDRKLLKTKGDDFESFEMFFKSSPRATDAAIRLLTPVENSSDIEYKNVQVQQVFQPKIILRNLSYSSGIGIEELPKIKFTEINPTKYRIRVEGAKDPYTLVFNENFYEGWKLYNLNKTDEEMRMTLMGVVGEIGEKITGLFLKNKEHEKETASYFNGDIKEGTHQMIFLEPASFETWGQTPIAEGKHDLINGYANSWYIGPEDVGGKENYELIVEFWPQRLFYIGLFISSFALINCLGYLLYSVIRKLSKKI